MPTVEGKKKSHRDPPPIQKKEKLKQQLYDQIASDVKVTIMCNYCFT